MKPCSGWIPLILLFVYLVFSIILAVNPEDVTIWWSENSIIWALTLLLIILWFSRIRFSATAYLLMFVFMCWHTVGGHYTFEKAPFGFITDLLGAERNHFDRVAHFMVGFFAWPIMEWIEQKNLSRSLAFTAFVGICAIFGWSALFEIIEWGYAEWADPAAGIAFLGSQGDVWDAQKDMLADGLGAIATALAYCLFHHGTEQSDSNP